jgi:hypothetical protein
MAKLLLPAGKGGHQQKSLKKLHQKVQLWHPFLAMGVTGFNFKNVLMEVICHGDLFNSGVGKGLKQC